MTTKTGIAFAAAGVAALFSLSAAQATSTPRQSNMAGQSAQAGTAFDADMLAEYHERRPMLRDRYEMEPFGDWYMSEDEQFDRAARPGRQR